MSEDNFVEVKAKIGSGPRFWPDTRRDWPSGRMAIGHKITLTVTFPILFKYGGRLEHLHRILASPKRRQKVNPVPGSVTGPVSNEKGKCGYGS
jgi:hypothetical protein